MEHLDAIPCILLGNSLMPHQLLRGFSRKPVSPFHLSENRLPTDPKIQISKILLQHECAVKDQEAASTYVVSLRIFGPRYGLRPSTVTKS